MEAEGAMMNGEGMAAALPAPHPLPRPPLPALRQAPLTRIGMRAADSYEFYVVLRRAEVEQMQLTGRVRPGPHVSLRQHVPMRGWDGRHEAIKRKEYHLRMEVSSWPRWDYVMVCVEFTASGFAHFKNIGDLSNSWESWWRLYGDLYATCQDNMGTMLYECSCQWAMP